MTKVTKRPYKEEEFNAFLQIIKKKSIKNWSLLADALGVDKNTISMWKKHPDARKAIAEGIEEAFDEMERTGRNDWRMWETKLKMFGINPAQKIETDRPEDPVLKILLAFGLMEGGNNAGQATAVESATSKKRT